MKKQFRAPLTAVRHLGSGIFLHLYHDPEIASGAAPGQFVNVRVGESTSPLLRRPFSICHVERDRGLFSVFFKVVGEGTETLARAEAGDEVDMVGPLGTRFEWMGVERALLVGGGVGIAPLYFMAREIRESIDRGGDGPRVAFAYGARNADGLALLDEIAEYVDEIVVTTEDGSQGARGYITSRIGPFLDQGYTVFCCGPTPMMAATLKMMRDRSIDTGQFSLENQMGCAVGVCQGCVVPTRNGYLRICCDGPVVSAEIMDFEQMVSMSAP